MDCAVIRQDLGEHVVGTLPRDRRQVLEAHLAWCAGCRKEAGELADGAAAAGFLVPAVDPPPELEDRVVIAVQQAAGRRQRSRGTRTVLAAAAAVALLSGVVAVAMAGRVQRLEDAAVSARQDAEAAAREFQEVLEESGGAAPILAAPLEGSGQAGGRALLFDARRDRDVVVVIVGGLPAGGGPYRAYLISPAERRLAVGRLTPEAPGQVSRSRFFGNLSGYRQLVVVDRTGQTVLAGSFAVSS
jgi:anti-sigma factor RsiW